MSKKISTLITATGSLILLVALCLVPAAVIGRGDFGMRAASAALFSFGCLLVAAGLYIKAQSLTVKPGVAESPSKNRRGGCEKCQEGNPVIFCKVHNTHLCEKCLANHYDFRSCVYSPSTRHIAAKGTKHLTKARGA